MAEEKPTRKTAAKKPAARRTPAKKTEKAPAEAPEPSAQEKTIAQQQEKVATYNALKERNLPIPAELREEVEAVTASESKAQQLYIRALNGQCRIKLERHTPQQKGIVLQARGTRGDLAPVQPEDLNDPIFIDNTNLLFEIITEEEAREIVSKQTTNQQAVHPALAALRNEKGEEYGEDAVKVTASYEDQGVVVAELDNGQIAFDRKTGIRRKAGESPGTPGYVAGAEPNHLPEGREAEYLSDLKAREKRNADLGLKVSVNPVQKS